MQISMDAETWRPFAPFLLAARDGLSGRQAWEVAGGAPIHDQHGQFRSAMDDIADLDAITSTQADLNIAPTLSFGSEEAFTADSDSLEDTFAQPLDLLGADTDPAPAEYPVTNALADSEVSPPAQTAEAPTASEPAPRRQSTGAMAAVGGTRRTTGARPMPEKVTLEASSEKTPVMAIVAVGVVVGAVLGALVMSGVLTF